MTGAQLDDTLRQPGIPAKQAAPYQITKKGRFMVQARSLAGAAAATFQYFAPLRKPRFSPQTKAYTMHITSIARPGVLVTALLGAALASGSASAHQIWLQQDGQAASVYFGEFGDNLREASPGLLDKFRIQNVTWIAPSGSKPLQASKTAGAFVLNGKVAPGESIIVEENTYPSWEEKKEGKATRTVWIPAARLIADGKAQAPALALDLVPTGTPGQFQVSYRGKPLAQAKVNAVVQSGWGKEAWSDAQGLVSFPLPWQGTYVLEVQHTDKTAGQRGAEHYDKAMYVTTLSLLQPHGVAPLPAPAAPPPSKDHD